MDNTAPAQLITAPAQLLLPLPNSLLPLPNRPRQGLPRIQACLHMEQKRYIMYVLSDLLIGEFRCYFGFFYS